MRLYVVLFLLIMPLTVFSGQEQVVRGAGPSTKIVELFFQHFTKLPEAQGYHFKVEPESIKHAGGVKAAETALFGRSGRPLNDSERSLGKYEILIAKAPIAIVTGAKTGVKKLSIGDLARIYGRRVKNWKQLGGADHPILLLGREPTEIAYTEIKKHHAFMRSISFDKVFKKDPEMVAFIQSSAGDYAIGFGSRENFQPQYRVQMLGFTAGVELGLIYDQANVGHPVILAAERYAASQEWRRVLLQNNLYPAMR